MKIMTIVGTRPEVIRLAEVIKFLDKFCNHILVHTGQNFNYELNKVFFEDLKIRKPDIQLNVKSKNLHEQISKIILQTGNVLKKEKPDALLILGDTNSALSSIYAKRLKIPIYHMEAGDRSFDEEVPEEINRRIVDHVSDVLLPYTEYSRYNLLREGIHPSKIYVTGSPIAEVYHKYKNNFLKSKILKKLNLRKRKFITASIHREENVETTKRLKSMIECYNLLSKKFKMQIIVSTHPRTKAMLEKKNFYKLADKNIVWHKPFGLNDYIKLQLNSFCVVSDSGTIHEDSSILNFPAVAIRKSTEKSESIDAGHCIITGLKPNKVLESVQMATSDFSSQKNSKLPEAYLVKNVASKIGRIIIGMNDVIKTKVWGEES
ncbi:UDP-N-acetylglucosamine 2-epimerase (non-hydrolyzing) [Candidatus Pelagibacter sp.]|nr:UDP-N-acetylglucosamine 2-epimerase (non-hydrolyzing) [Candidatus Pelagibacter sp.]